MASDTIYTATYKFVGDNSDLLSTVSQNEKVVTKSASSTEQTGTKSASKLQKSWSVATGVIAGVAASAFSKISSAISSSIGSAINRVDTLNNFPKVMQSLGFSGDEASASVNALSSAIDGLPTGLNDIVGNVQALTASMGNLNQGTVNATSVGIAFNNMMLASGASGDEASRAFVQFNQMLAKGKVDMQSWNSIAMSAPGQMRQLAESLLGAGKNGQDLYQALSDGEVSFDDFNSALVRLNEEGGDGFASFSEQARDATGGIGTAMENVKNRISKAIGTIIQTIGQENISNAINGISSAFAKVAEVVAGIIKFFMENEVARTVLIAFLTTLGLLLLGTVVPAFIAWTAALLANPLTWIVLAITAVITALILLVTHIEEVGAFFIFIFGAVGEFIGGVVGNIGAFFVGLWEGITGIFGGIGQWFGDRFQEAYNLVTGIFRGIGEFFSGVWTKITEIFGGIGTAIGDAVGGAFKTVVNGVLGFIEGFINGPIDLINGFLSLINGAFGFVGVNIGMLPRVGLPRMYTGGIVEPYGGGTPIIAGDGGEDEWVVPESKFASLIDQLEARGATSDVINITVEGVFATSPAEQRRVAEQIADALQTVNRQRFVAGYGGSL